MIIKNVDIKHYRIPLRTEMTDAMHGVMTHFEVIMVRLESDDGAQGLGYTYTIGQGGATIYSLIEQALKPILLGANPRCIEQLWEKMWWQLHYIGRGGVVSFAMRSCRCSRARPKPSACAAAVIPTEAPWMTCAGGCAIVTTAVGSGSISGGSRPISQERCRMDAWRNRVHNDDCRVSRLSPAVT